MRLGIGLGIGVGGSPAAQGFNPTSIGATKLKLFLLSDQGSPTVSSWTDLSGNGNHCTQGTGANQPTVTASWSNSRPAFKFGATKWMVSAALGAALSGTVAIWLACQLDNLSGTYVLFDRKATGSNYQIFTTNTPNASFNVSGSQATGSSSGLTSPAIVKAKYVAGSGTFLYVNGTQVAHDATTSATTLDGFTLGNQNSHSFGGPANIGGVIVLANGFSAGDEANVDAYLKSYFGTP